MRRIDAFLLYTRVHQSIPMKVLCVAEKPLIAKEVANILGGGRVSRRDSPERFIKNYDFTFLFEKLGSCEVTMTLVLGHMTNLDYAPGYGWGECPPIALFDADLKKTTLKRGVADNITREARVCQYLMIWTDCDREGEHIGYEVWQQALKGNSGLNRNGILVLRAHFSHLDRAHIIHAANHPTNLDMKQVNAVIGRQELDFRVGTSFTRLLTDKLKSAGIVQTVALYGTCQFPTLGFIVDRYKRVKKFVSEEFWYITMNLKDTDEQDSKPVTFHWARGRYFDRLFVYLIYQRGVVSGGKNAKVHKLETKSVTRYKPFPLTTVDLQKDCAKYFRMSAKEALTAAEKLYNQGFLSYPRTETNRYPDDFDHRKLVKIQEQDMEWGWGHYAKRLLESDALENPRVGTKDDKAHPPIHPIKFTSKKLLLDCEKKVYEYVVRRYLAGVSKDSLGQETKCTLQWMNTEEYFVALGLLVLERNFLDIFHYWKWGSTKKLPRMQEGTVVKPTLTRLMVGKTVPPKHMSETELIALMDANGIGTDATIAEHIDKIITREYVAKMRKANTVFLLPTPLGMGIIEGLDRIPFDISLSKPFLRRQLEGSLQDICEGDKSKESVVQEVLAIYKPAFSLLKDQSSTLTNTCASIIAQFC